MKVGKKMSLEEKVAKSFELHKKEGDSLHYIKYDIIYEYSDRFNEIAYGILMPLSFILGIGGFLVACFTCILALQIIGISSITAGVIMPFVLIVIKMEYLDDVEAICDRLLEVADTPTEDVEYVEVKEFHLLERTSNCILIE